MHKRGNILWRKAAVLGSIWAASEIVLGSFLHNARVPFKGGFLAAIGIAILVAGHRLWPERGLLWRAGLICAAMKSVSPSAVIFGPMVAISMEGLLAEAGLRLLGANTAGYLLAGGLAMSWAFIHKTGNLLIYYGSDAIAVYLRGMQWLREYLNFGPGDWTPLAALAALYFLAGAAAAAAGLRAGTSAAAQPEPSGIRPALKGRRGGEAGAHKCSTGALLLHIILIVVTMAAGRGVPLAALAAWAAAYALLCSIFYPKVRALLGRAGVWAGVLAASLAAGLILGSPQAGAYMALRAFLLTLGFAAIGCELAGPAIRAWLERLGGGIFFETLEYSFASLPGIIEGLPSGRDFLRRPLASLGGTVARAPFLLDSLPRPKVFVIKGGHGCGKSEFVLELARLLRAAGIKPGGICAAGLWEDGLRSGFDLVDLSCGARAPLCRRGAPGAVRAGEFGFFPQGLAAGEAALSRKGLSGAAVVFVDEVGFLELEGGGWAPALERLLTGRRPVVLVVRDHLVEKVRGRWELERCTLWSPAGITPQQAAAELLKL